VVEEQGPVKTFNRPWLYLRSFVFWLWLIFTTAILGTTILLSLLVSYNLAYFFARTWLRANIYGLRYICGVTWKIDGLENIPAKPCVVMAKHQSTWDACFLPMILPGGAVYVAKRSLVWIPVFGWAIWGLGFIMIDRKSGRSAISQMVQQATDRLGRGRWVMIFPEGTRRPVGAEPNYRIGGAIVAEKTSADVLPVAANAGEFWPRMGFIKWPGEVTVSFGPLISTAGKDANAIRQETQDWIESRMAEITVIDRFPY
jgi:1-acyl-sn-glycerol-3-phosphate acyltransferase